VTCCGKRKLWTSRVEVGVAGRLVTLCPAWALLLNF